MSEPGQFGHPSPYVNRCMIEARVREGPYSKSSWGRKRERFTWCWFESRSIAHRDGENFWSDPIRIRVMVWGDELGQIMLEAEKNDVVYAEGLLTVTKDREAKYVLALLAKKVRVRKDLRPAAWKSFAERTRAIPRFRAKGMLPVTDAKLRAEEREKLVARGLIKPSAQDLARMPEKVPEHDYSDYDFGV